MLIRNLFLLGMIVVLFPCLIYCSKSKLSEEEAKSIIQKFYSDNVPESMLDRYLLDAGKPIVPYLVIEIENKKMPKRGYAILALGKIHDSRALPVLEKIMNDKMENTIIRGDTLTAIWHIDRKLGEEYAKKYGGDNGYIDRTIQLLKEGAI